jgi:hypothetical protein
MGTSCFVSCSKSSQIECESDFIGATSSYNLYLQTWQEEFEYQGDTELLNCTIIVQYPLVAEMKDTSLQDKINGCIYTDISSRIEDFKNNLNKYWNTSYRRNVTIEFMTADYLSILYEGITENGWARPYQFAETLNVNIKNGTPMVVSDFFVPDVDGPTLLMNYCKQDLIKQYEEFYKEEITGQFLMLIDWGVTPESCSNFSITSKGFHLIFIDVFSHAEGIWEVYAPYSAFGEQCLLNE